MGENGWLNDLEKLFQGLHSTCWSVQHQCIMAKQLDLFFTWTYEHAISDKASAMCKHLKVYQLLIFVRNLCNLPDTLDFDNFPPNFSCKCFPQLVRSNTTVLDCDSNWSVLLYN